MRRLLPILIVATVLGTESTDAHAKGIGEFTSNVFNRLMVKVGRRPGESKQQTTARNWAASPPQAAPPKAANNVQVPPKALKNGGFKSTVQARWNQFKQTSMGQQMQAWRGGISSFFSRLRSPRKMSSMRPRERSRTLQFLKQVAPGHFDKAVAWAKATKQRGARFASSVVSLVRTGMMRDNKRDLRLINDALAKPAAAF